MTSAVPPSVSRAWAAAPARWRGVGVTIVVALLVLFVVPALWPHAAPRGQILNGAEIGAVNGLLALGLVLTYRASRVINFSYGAMGALAATVAVELNLADHVNWFACLGIALLVGAGLGLLVDCIIRWRFFTAPRLIVMVVTIGLAQLFGGIQLLVPGWLGGPSIVGGVTTPLTAQHVLIFPVLFNGNDLLIAVVVPVVLVVLGWFLLRTDAGVAVRSVADNSDRARLLGIPVRRLSTLVWVIAGVLAGLTSMLSAPSAGITIAAGAGPTLILPALAAAIIAGMESLPLAFGAAVALGVTSGLFEFNMPRFGSAVGDVVNLVAILVGLLFFQRRRSRADDAEESFSATGILKPIPAALRSLPEVVAGRIALMAVVVVVVVVVPLVSGPGTTLEYTAALIYGIIAISLVVLTGWSGNVSLGQFAFAGVGGVLAGELIEKSNADLFLSLAAAGAAGAVLAVIVGVPALRIRGGSGRSDPGPRRGHGHLLPQSHLLPEHHSAGLSPAGAVAAFRPGLQQVLLLLLSRLLGIDDRVHSGPAQGPVGARAARAARQREGRRRHVGSVRAHQAGRVRPGRRHRRHRRRALRRAAGSSGLQHVRPVLWAGRLLHGRHRRPRLPQRCAHGGRSHRGAELLVPQIPARVHRCRAAPRPAVPPGRPGRRRAERAGPRAAVGGDAPAHGGAQPGCGPQGRAARSRAGGIVAAGARAERGGSRCVQRDAGARDTRRGHRRVPVATSLHPDELAPDTPVVLSCQKVEVSDGPVQILFGVDLDVHEGEIVALLGTNGAGKSTLLKGASGLVKVGGGIVRFAGEAITGEPAEAVAWRGLSLMPGGRGVFPTLSVEENLRLGAWMIRKDHRAVSEARTRVIDLFPILRQRRQQQAGNLSGGEQQMLSLAMALMVKPTVLMIDELSLGLAPTVVGQLLQVVKMLHAAGTTIVVVEQSVNVALELAERAVFLEKGEVRFSGRTLDLLDRPDILRSVFIAGAGSVEGTVVTPDAGPADLHPLTGASSAPVAAEPHRRVPPSAEAPSILECRGVRKTFGGITALEDISLTLRDGEILGLIGHNGAGKTTFFDCVSGFLPLDGGWIRLGGVDIDPWPAHLRAAAGLGRTFQEARLFPSLTVAETIAVAQERHLRSRSMLAAVCACPHRSTRRPSWRRRRASSLRRWGSARSGRSSSANYPPGRAASWSWPASSPRSRGCSCSTSRRAASPSARRRPWVRCSSGSSSTPAAPSWSSNTTCPC